MVAENTVSPGFALPSGELVHLLMSIPQILLTMKYALLLCLALPVVHILNAQPVITRETLIKPGDTYTSAQVEDVPDPGPYGVDVVWDFSAVMASSPGTYLVLDPASTPFGNLFPDANAAVRSPGGQLFQYHRITDSAWEEQGYVQPAFATLTYDNPRLYLPLPMTYPDLWQDEFTYELSYEVDPPLNADGDGVVEGEVDGYGTLMLPQGTFDSVLRVKTLGVYGDTADIVPGIVTERNIYHDTTYLWFDPGYHAPLCTWVAGSLTRITTAIQGGDTTVVEDFSAFRVFLIDPAAEPSVSAIDRNSSGGMAVMLAPNPFGDLLNLRVSSEHAGELTITLRDTGGRSVYLEVVDLMKGDQTISISPPVLSSGMYYVTLQSGTERVVFRAVHLGQS
jgi:hypothetical protein